MFPAKFAPVLFGFLVSGLMSLMVSCIATLRIIGMQDDFVSTWISGWVSSWIVAFPVILVVAPIVRKVVARIIIK